MSGKIDLKFAIGLKPEKAIEYFKSKGYTFSWDWHETRGEAHAKAFTVAKVMRMDILQDIRSELDRAMEEGTTFKEFKKNLTPILQRKGWWGRKVVGDGKGGAEEVQLGSPRRLKLIYETNLQANYMTGRKKDMLENVDDRTWWQYVAILDKKTRPGHAAMHGKVFRYDDPVWQKGPPYDFACRCRVRPLSERNIKQRGLHVEDTAGKWKEEDVLLSKKSGEVVKVEELEVTDPRTGKPITFRPGAGWGHDAVKAAWQPEINKYDYDIAKKYVEGAVTGPDFTRFFEGKVKGIFPVAVLNEEYRRAIGAQTQSVLLSDETLRKNRANHPEMRIADYQKLPDIIQRAQLIVQDKESTFVFLKVGETIYYGAVKTTGTGKANFLTSLRIARESDINAIRKKGKVLRDEL